MKLKCFNCGKIKSIESIDLNSEDLNLICDCGVREWQQISESLYYRLKLMQIKKIKNIKK